jgi:hypothetical protein
MVAMVMGCVCCQAHAQGKKAAQHQENRLTRAFSVRCMLKKNKEEKVGEEEEEVKNGHLE